MTRIILSIVLCFAICFTIQAQQSKKLDQPLADSLAKWVEIDQIAAKPKPADGRFKMMDHQQWNAYKDSVFSIHQVLLSKIFSACGYPGYDLAGKAGSNNFWLMVQHCDKQPAFQQSVLTAMKKEVDRGNADGKSYAYLLDRVNLNTGRKQVYGTQVTYNTDSCQAIPKPLADSLLVNQRRKGIGLEPIESYLNMMSESHFYMNKDVYEKKGIHQPKLIPEPKQ
jgi:hypothetical protein